MTEAPKTAIDLMRRGPVIPVVVLDRAVDAVPLARALLAGGVDTMEITLRTTDAVEAIRAVAGGTAALRALAGPLPEITFCPTGGIDRAAVDDYLALPNVACVGGSWLTPSDLTRAQDWDAITAHAAETLTGLREITDPRP
jgi:2-keto-3-deoxy-6-phosphogluconate aldolase